MREAKNFFKFNHLDFMLPYISSIKVISSNRTYVMPYKKWWAYTLRTALDEYSKHHDVCLLELKIEGLKFCVDFASIKNYE